MSSAEKAVTPASSSSTAEVTADERIEVMKQAEDLMAKGKRNMVCGEVPKAVNLFEEAVKLLVNTYGDMSRDCADAYYHWMLLVGVMQDGKQCFRVCFGWS